MKKSFGFAVAVMATFTFAAATFADDGEVRLIYPTDAAAAELDSSRPEKRIEPPVRELSEQDVLTPLGQVRAVMTSLGRYSRGASRASSGVRNAKNRRFRAFRAGVGNDSEAATGNRNDGFHGRGAVAQPRRKNRENSDDRRPERVRG